MKFHLSKTTSLRTTHDSSTHHGKLLRDAQLVLVRLSVACLDGASREGTRIAVHAHKGQVSHLINPEDFARQAVARHS